jgi:hypothetical protein
VVLGVLGLLALPAAYATSYYLEQVTLIQSAAAMPVAGVFGIAAILLARRARREIQATLGRVGGGGTARLGHALGVVSLCIGITAGLALAFFGLLTLFAAD